MKKYVFISYLIVGIAGLIFSGLYLFSSHFMPYHAEAVSMEWNDVNVEFQVLILALMRVSGGGWLATSISIFVLLFVSLKRNIYWVNPVILVLGMSALIPSLVATFTVKFHTMGNPPWLLTVSLIVLLLCAFSFSTLSYTTKRKKILIIH